MTQRTVGDFVHLKNSAIPTWRHLDLRFRLNRVINWQIKHFRSPPQ